MIIKLKLNINASSAVGIEWGKNLYCWFSYKSLSSQIYAGNEYLCGTVVAKVPKQAAFVIDCKNYGPTDKITVTTVRSLEVCEVLIYG